MPSSITTSSETRFKLKKSKLLELYDVKRIGDKDTGSPITAITSLIGEDLVLGLLSLYFKETGRALRCQPDYKCTSGQQRGPWLDAWLLTRKGELFQTEVKNWCASAIGGVSVDEGIEVGSTRRNQRRRYTWFEAAESNRERYLNHKDVAAKVWKVLVPMKQPKGWPRSRPKPLLAFWSPVAPLGAKKERDLKPFFQVKTSEFRTIIGKSGLKLPKKHFSRVWIFSASNYLRGLTGRETIEIPMRRVQGRLEELRKVGFPIKL